MKEVTKICIDISNINPGQGGSGGGISTYAINLIKNLDTLLKDDNIVVYCLKNSKFKGLNNLEKVKTINVSLNNHNLLSRIFWLNIRLPLFCHSHKITALHRVIPELPIFKVCKYIVTVHDFMFDLYLNNLHLKKYLSNKNKYKFYLLRWLCKLAINISDLIIVPSDTIKEELNQKFNVSHKAIVINEASEKVNNKYSKSQSERSCFKIGVIAGFYPHKGHFEVLDLARNFLNRGFNDFRIYFRGSQIYKNYVSDLQAQIYKLGLDKFVVFEPFKTNISLSEIYSDYDLILLLSEYEGFGLPVLEAQSHSVPVLCANIPIFRENLKDSALYLNSAYSDEDLLILIEQLKDENNMKKIAQAGMKNVKKFSWQKVAKTTITSYKSILEGNKL